MNDLNPTEVPVVEAIRAVNYAYGLPLLVPWPVVTRVLWVSREGSSWLPAWGRLNWARTIWLN